MEGLSGELSIGLVYPATGRLAPVGMEMGSGFELALEEINNSQLGNTKLKFITEDDQSTVEGAVEAFNKLIYQDGVSVILGPATSSATEVAFPIAQHSGVVAISSRPPPPAVWARLATLCFALALTTDVLIPSGVRITQEKLGYQKVATIYDDIDLFSTDSDAVVKEAPRCERCRDSDHRDFPKR